MTQVFDNPMLGGTNAVTGSVTSLFIKRLHGFSATSIVITA